MSAATGYSKRSADQYFRSDILTTDPVGVIILLYEGVMDFNNSAALAMRNGDIEARNSCINRSINILGELSAALDYDNGGLIARNLGALYSFMAEELARANLANATEPLETVNRLLGEIKEGWEGIRGRSNAAAVEVLPGGRSISARL